ncbi:LacI family DNA-binding transcriptional regulator [Cellulomonas timonensis]|uniref:LacI family DNA-binding transcriptional regulator n=1 Tax=Cellulomonas timonensis TaxID=1689271 RepID=UPI000834EE49|nr:LacI family DNA-binding transcriptional regulator [Cellulomonas timonensis]
MARKVTVRDVAAAAGVSTATASRALTHSPSVNPEMARRVLKASSDLGYSANVFARALRTQRTDTIGMVVPSINNDYFTAAVEAVEKELADSGRSLILCDARESVETEAQRIELLVQRMVDGLIVVPVTAFDSVPAIEQAVQQGPVVLLDRWADAAGADYVGGDNADGLRQCVVHLREQGCSSIVYVGAQPRTSTAYERHKAFRELMEPDSGADGPGVHGSALLGEFSFEWGVEATRQLLAGDVLPHGIVCGADIIAVGVLSTLREAGVVVPDQVKVVSYDDSFLGRLTMPRLSSVRQPIDAMAAEAVRLLDDRSGRTDAPVRKSIFMPSLVVRESTGR